MRSTFRVLFYTKNQSIKNGKVPVMGRITINKTTACFSCKKEVSISLWDAKANRAKGKSEEARMLNQELDNAKAQIAKHLQSPNQKIPDRKTKCVIKTHINIKQNVIFGAKLKPV